MEYDSVQHFDPESSHFPDNDTVKLLSDACHERLHRFLLKWVSCGSLYSIMNSTPLQLAAGMGWQDVAREMYQNPFLLPYLFNANEETGGVKEPGILHAEYFILNWSRLSPDQYLARFLASVNPDELVELAIKANAQPGKPDFRLRINSPITPYHHQMEKVKTAMAIAWTRCRKHLDVE